jgi:hypothetical protein
MTPNQILKKKVEESLRNLKNNQRATVKEVLAELNKTKTELTTLLKGTERFEMGYYRAILRGVNEKIDEFTGRMSKSVAAGQDQAFTAGSRLVPEILKDAGMSYTFGKLSDELIVAAKELTVDYVKDMSKAMKDDIAKAIRGAILKGENSFDTARKIDEIIGASKTTGYLNRSDVIARTEIGRAYSVARQAKDEQVAEKVPGLKKQWVTGFNPRNKDMGGGRGFISHSDVDGQIRDVDEPFDVGGEQLMAPRMGEKPENNCSCNCQSCPYMEEWPS